MGFSSENGYIPQTVEEILQDIMGGLNTQFGTTYTWENFVGTNFYKYMYALAQKVQEGEIKTSETFLYLQQYFDVINGRIQRPVATSPGIIEALESEDYIASVKPMISDDAGKVSICVDVDDTDPDYAATKLAINTIIMNSIAAGVVTQGTESSTIVLSNGQPFDFKFLLPDRAEPLLRLTLTLSDNNQVVVGSPDDVKVTLLANIAAKYRLGLDFEPQKYFTTADAPWTSKVLLEYSLDAGSNWLDDIFEASFDDLFDINLENIEVVEE